MNIQFKRRQELLQITERNKVKKYQKHNELYLEYINSLVEKQAKLGTTTFLDFDKDWRVLFESCVDTKNLPRDARSWYQLIKDLEILLQEYTDWKVAVMKRRYIDEINYELCISWGGN